MDATVVPKQTKRKSRYVNSSLAECSHWAAVSAVSWPPQLEEPRSKLALELFVIAIVS